MTNGDLVKELSEAYPPEILANAAIIAIANVLSLDSPITTNLIAMAHTLYEATLKRHATFISEVTSQ